MKIGVLVGSLRKESYNLKVAHSLIELAPKELAFEIVEIGLLPFYDQDLEVTRVPEAWRNFRERIKPLDGVLFVTPEYNRSIPGVLKNAIDVGSRPMAENVWSGKAGGVVSVSIGAAGGMAANFALRQTLIPVDLAVMPGPEMYIGKAQDLYEQNTLKTEKTKAFFATFMVAYAQWVRKIRAN